MARLPGQDGYFVAEAARVLAHAAAAPYSDDCRRQVLEVLHLVALSEDGGTFEQLVLRVADFVEVLACVAGAYARDNYELRGQSRPKPGGI